MGRPGEGNVFVGAAELIFGARGMTYFAELSGSAYNTSAADFGLHVANVGDGVLREVMMLAHQPGMVLSWMHAAPTNWGYGEAASQLLYADAYGGFALAAGGLAILGLSDIRRGIDGWGGRNR